MINITSTTDTKEAVTAALGDLASRNPKVDMAVVQVEKPVTENKEASAVPKDEKIETAKEETAEEKSARETLEKKAKKKGGFKKKIDKLNARVSAAEQEREYWRSEALKAKAPADKAIETKVVAKADGKPDPEKFEKHEDYIEALSDWKVDQKLKARDKETVEKDLKRQFDSQVAKHSERVESFKKDHADFGELMESVDDIPMSLTIQTAILESDNGAELMYELAKDREEYERICKLPAIAAARAIGRFEAKIAKPSKPIEKETKEAKTKVPPPLTPVGAKGTISVEKDPEKMSHREYCAWRDAGGGR